MSYDIKAHIMWIQGRAMEKNEVLFVQKNGVAFVSHFGLDSRGNKVMRSGALAPGNACANKLVGLIIHMSVRLCL